MNAARCVLDSMTPGVRGGMSHYEHEERVIRALSRSMPGNKEKKENKGMGLNLPFGGEAYMRLCVYVHIMILQVWTKLVTLAFIHYACMYVYSLLCYSGLNCILLCLNCGPMSNSMSSACTCIILYSYNTVCVISHAWKSDALTC